MACIDFSFDSRIRKKYVPLINQQRYLRHVKRIAARNLIIPEALLQSFLINDKFLGKTREVTGAGDHESDSEEESVLYSKLNIFFYFSIYHPSSSDCNECNKFLKKSKKEKCCNCGKLLYRSECLMSTNPSWKGFEGSALCSPSISQFIVRVYFVQLDQSKNIKQSHNNHRLENENINHKSKLNKKKYDNFSSKLNMNHNNNCNNEIGTLFLEWNVNLTGLLYIGEEFPKDRRLTNNSIIFGFAEGFYTSVCSVASEVLLTHSIPPSESLQITDISSIRNSYHLNTLIRIQMVQCIIQTTAAQVKLERKSLEEVLEQVRQKHELLSEIDKIQSSIEFLENVSKRRKEKLKECASKIEQIHEKIHENNMDMSTRFQILKEEFNMFNELRTMKLVETSRKLEQIRNSLAHQRKLLARKLFRDIFIIVPFPDGIGYSINNIYLPSAEKVDQHQHKMLAIGLGYVAHLVHLLSIVLDIFLFHQIIPYGSRSSICDLYNKILRDKEKVVPLYAKSKSNLNMIFFKHGWHLLNRLIVFYRQSMGLNTQDFATTLCNIYSLYKERFLPDDCFISEDETLNRFNTYSPSLHNSRESTATLNDENNQKVISDINDLKNKNYMLDNLWKEVEQMTLNSIKNDFPSSQQFTVFCDEIKDIISKQRQKRRILNVERLSQLTSSLNYCQASSSFDLLTPNVQSSVISTTSATTSSSSPQNISRPRRISMTHSSFASSDGTTTANEMHSMCASPFRMVNGGGGYCSFQQFNSIRRIRSVSNYGNSAQSLPMNHSFLYPRNITEIPDMNPQLSMSLDNGLNLVQTTNNHAHSLNSKSSATNSLDSSQVDVERIPFLNAELLNENNHHNDCLNIATTTTTTAHTNKKNSKIIESSSDTSN